MNRKEYWQKYGFKRNKAGLCINCGNEKTPNTIKCNKCISKARTASRNFREKHRLKVYEHYGKSCKCCGESHPCMLTIDHIENVGKDRMNAGLWYQWITKNNFPPNLQTLCHNCNQSKYRNKGICAHKLLSVDAQA